MKKTRKLISMLVALMACTFIACSDSSSSDDDDAPSAPIDAAFRDCTRTVSDITLSDGSWTLKVAANESGFAADSIISLTASNGSYTFNSGSATSETELDRTTLAVINSLSQAERDEFLRDMASESEASDITLRGNKIITTTTMSRSDLQEMQSSFDLNSFPPSVTIRTNSDNTKYVITNSQDRSTVMYLSKNSVQR
ncbi:MAG: hypothetical protein IJJ66_03680 [Treponema sp.]|nr:hypothetical protein [Treponema sp.]